MYGIYCYHDQSISLSFHPVPSPSVRLPHQTAFQSASTILNKDLRERSADTDGHILHFLNKRKKSERSDIYMETGPR